jgi:hypothetical protein
LGATNGGGGLWRQPSAAIPAKAVLGWGLHRKGVWHGLGTCPKS